MKRKLSLAFALTAISFLQLGCGEPESPTRSSDEAIDLVYQGKLTMPQAEASCACRLELIPIRGTVFHFGLDLSQTPPVSFPFQSTVSGLSDFRSCKSRLIGTKSGLGFRSSVSRPPVC